MKNLVAFGLCLCLVSPLLAGPLDAAKVPADAKWVLHVDMEKLVASKVGNAILEEGNKQGLDIGLAMIKAAVGVDLVKDIKNGTAFGTKFGDESGAVAIQGTLDKEKILKALKLNPTFKEDKYGAVATYQWTEEAKDGKPAQDRFGAFVGDDTAAIATSAAQLKLVIDVLGGKAAGLAKVPAFDKSAFLVAFVTDLPSAARKPEEAFLKKFAGAQASIGENENSLWAAVAVTAKDEATAADLKQVADALPAIVRLIQPGATAGPGEVKIAATTLPEGLNSPEAIAVLKSLKVSQAGMTVSVEGSLPVKDVIKLIQEAVKKKPASAPAGGVIIKKEFKFEVKTETKN
jgi:hypothetical protein